MTKLLRPYIPLEVRCLVALRQLDVKLVRGPDKKFGQLLAQLLRELRAKLGCDHLHLDHDPALENRTKLYRNRGSETPYAYVPDANDPDFLIYRDKHDHHIKTNVRGEHGQFADNVIAKRERRRVKKFTKPKRKHKWATGRKIRSRNDLRRRP